jgi:hypothetical protein
MENTESPVPPHSTKCEKTKLDEIIKKELHLRHLTSTAGDTPTPIEGETDDSVIQWLSYSVAIGCEELSTVNEQGGLSLPSSTTQSVVEPWKDPIVTIGLFGGTHASKELVPAIPRHWVGVGTIDKSWIKYFTVDKVPGDGECFFSSVNFLMQKQDKGWRYDNISLRATTLQQYEKTFFQFYRTTNTEIELLSLQQRWSMERARFQSKGQYADHELMMATVILFNIDIQIHGGANTLLTVDGRTPRFTINLLYSGAQTYLNRGNHYDPLTPKDTPLTLSENLTTHSKWITVGNDLSPSEAEKLTPPPSPSKPKSRSLPISPTSFSPRSKHEEREP